MFLDTPAQKKMRPWNQQLTRQKSTPRLPQGDGSFCQNRQIHNSKVTARLHVECIKDTSRIAPPFWGAVENQDFVVIAQTGKNPKGGRPSIEYHLTIDVAKELSMVERNGKIAARSFWKKT